METENQMKLSVSTGKNAISASYASLIAKFPLRPLHDEVDYDNALEVAESLVGLPRLSADQADYLDVLTDIIEKYEGRHHRITAGHSPLKALKAMVEEQGMSASDLGRLLGNRALGAALLRGDRELSKTHIRVLADHFKVSTDLFIE
jgi:HTH-type transcriptional regulator / antitoxin HigA